MAMTLQRIDRGSPSPAFMGLSPYAEGVVWSAIIVLIAGHGANVSADILQGAGCTSLDCSALDDDLKEALRIINQEKGMSLKGLE
jgi:hypothetical protein